MEVVFSIFGFIFATVGTIAVYRGGFRIHGSAKGDFTTNPYLFSLEIGAYLLLALVCWTLTNPGLVLFAIAESPILTTLFFASVYGICTLSVFVGTWMLHSFPWRFEAYLKRLKLRTEERNLIRVAEKKLQLKLINRV